MTHSSVETTASEPTEMSDPSNEGAVLREILAACDRLDAAFMHHYVRQQTRRIRELVNEFKWPDGHTDHLVGAALRLVGSDFPPASLENALVDAAILAGAERGFVLVYGAALDCYERIESSRLGRFSDEEVSLAEELARKAFERDSAILNPDLTVDPLYSGHEAVFALACRSIIVAPLSVDVESSRARFGVIYLDRPCTEQVFTAKDFRLLKSFASLIALSIRNIRLGVNLRLAYQATVQALVNALEARDPVTQGHSLRVAEYAERCGKRFELGMERLYVLRSAALLHDIGKIGIRDDVLKKPGRLTRDEFDHVKRHPEISAAILSGLDFLTQEMEILRQHHERFDGKGYPRGLAGDEISLEGAIIQVADAWDAMTSGRSYHREMTVEEAIEELKKNSGTQFNPRVVEVFVQVIEEEGLVRLT